MATPFVQGALRKEALSGWIETECAHCGQELHIKVDSNCDWTVAEPDANPLLFVPEIDWQHFSKANIIHDY